MIMGLLLDSASRPESFSAEAIRRRLDQVRDDMALLENIIQKIQVPTRVPVNTDEAFSGDRTWTKSGLTEMSL